MLFLPAVTFVMLAGTPDGTYTLMPFLNSELLVRFDKLSKVFGYVFIIITFIGVIYALHVKGAGELAASFIHAGSALGAVFAGDLLSLFVFWEMLTLSAAFIIWSRRSRRSQGAGFRYLLVHLFGGMCLLAGIIMHVKQAGSLEFGYIGVNGLASYLMLLGVAVNTAIPPLHAWLTDAYPEASVTGTVFLSVFTTKTAVYVLARAFPGADILVIVGAIMTIFPIFYAVLENDLRRVLCYSLINQVGFMVVGVGIGTSLAINGAAAHAFADVLFKSLLLMSVGAVMYRTGTCLATDLGGLYKTMPITMFFCIVGAASISAFPLFSAFCTKSMIMSAAGHEQLTVIWLLLLFASAGVFHHAGIKIPYFTFFAHDSGKRPPEAPPNMLVAMGLAAFLCIFIGVYPQPLYNLLPYPVEYVPYTADHVVSQLLLLFCASLAFATLMITGYYPPEMRSVNLDTDWFYRKAGPAFLRAVGGPVAAANDWLGRLFLDRIPGYLVRFGQNPSAVMKLALETLTLPFRDEESRMRINKEKDALRASYSSYVLKPWFLSHSLLLVALFLAVYLVFYLLYSK
jgi:multicomponent Na+:H+ antiporter subunit D